MILLDKAHSICYNMLQRGEISVECYNHPMKYDKGHYVIAANDLIKGKSELTLQEARLVRLLIMQIAQQDKDLKTYCCRIQDLANYLDISSENLYRDVRNICESLISRKISIQTGNPKQPWKLFQWIQLAEYDGAGTITLMLSDQLKPYVLDLSKWFIKYKLSEILSMNSYYAIRFYELIKCYDGLVSNGDGTYEFTIEYLRIYFSCEDKYKLTSDFIRNVINISESEMNTKSDISIFHECIKDSRKIHKLKFFVSPNYKKIKRPVKG